MTVGAILAGGIGSRMGNAEKPKQFLHIGDRPILIHTAEKFISSDRIDKLIILSPKEWLAYTREILDKYLPGNEIAVAEGGSSRNETIMNAIAFIEENYSLDSDTVLITHDAARPFVTRRIIDENADIASRGEACTTAIAVTDTIAETDDGQHISAIPDRTRCLQVQTPQSFRAERFRELYTAMSEKQKEQLTDASRVLLEGGDSVAIIKGETENIKITYPADLSFASELLGTR